MAANQSNRQAKGSGSGSQGGSKSGNQKQGAGTQRKSSMKEDERSGASSDRGGMNK